MRSEVAGSTRRDCCGAEGIDSADDGVWCDVVVDARWQQADLLSAIAVDEAQGPPPLVSRC
jgi:hypothetical protein